MFYGTLILRVRRRLLLNLCVLLIVLQGFVNFQRAFRAFQISNFFVRNEANILRCHENVRLS